SPFQFWPYSYISLTPQHSRIPSPKQTPKSTGACTATASATSGSAPGNTVGTAPP
ncbi:hypothetical protein C7212DRAFT_22059, partial [Tuber magnatum]